MIVGKNLVILKIFTTNVAFITHGNLQAAPEETVQLSGMIKNSN